MIHIRQLNKSLLRDFIFSEEYKSLENIPISKHRALSHINNPRANEKDILLLLAYEGHDLIGYLGILPDEIFLNNKSSKCGWLSCLWVNQNHRGKQVALNLVKKSFEVWDKKILITEFTDSAKRLYDKTNYFYELAEKKGIKLYVRFNLYEILLPKKEVYRKFKFLLKTFDSVSNKIFDLRFYFLRNKLENIELEYVNYIDEELEKFIIQRNKKELFKRTTSDLNWIIKNPWILSSESEDLNSKRYYFSSVDKKFEFVPIKIYSNNNLVAFIIFARRNNNLKIPYYYGDDLDTIVEVINYYLVKWRVKTFTSFNKEIVLQLKNSKTPTLYKKETKRNYNISKVFDVNLFESDFTIQGGDGDCSFT